MLKFAAIGVKSVPQYPQVIPSAPTTAGFPPCIITTGTPTPMVMTVKAANAHNHRKDYHTEAVGDNTENGYSLRYNTACKLTDDFTDTGSCEYRS